MCHEALGMEIDSFEEIEEEFAARVQEQVWCNFSTVDRAGRPYSRIMHPFWERNVGWVLTHRNSHKSKHLASNNYVSLSYIRGAVQKPTYVDCVATWEEDIDEKTRLWNLVSNTPEPLGFDPSSDFGSPENEEFGLLKLTPRKIVLVTFPAESYDQGNVVWRGT
jgi:general stress protein 26